MHSRHYDFNEIRKDRYDTPNLRNTSSEILVSSARVIVSCETRCPVCAQHTDREQIRRALLTTYLASTDSAPEVERIVMKKKKEKKTKEEGRRSRDSFLSCEKERENFNDPARSSSQ